MWFMSVEFLDNIFKLARSRLFEAIQQHSNKSFVDSEVMVLKR